MSKRSCGTCKHDKCSIVQEPCKSCSGYQAGYSNWEKGNQEIINLIAENKRLKEEARSVISFAAKTEIEALRAQLAEKDKEIERLSHIVENGCHNESGECIWFHYNEKAEAENVELSRENEVLREQNFAMNKTIAELRERLKAVKKTYNQWAILDEPQYPHEAIENFISQRGNESWQAIKKAVGNESSDNR